jgi:hypothetical protein
MSEEQQAAKPLSGRARLGLLIDEIGRSEGLDTVAIAKAKRVVKCPLNEAEIKAIMAFGAGSDK